METKMRVQRRKTGTSGAAFAREIGMNPNVLTWVERGNAVLPAKWRSVVSAKLSIAEDELFDAKGFAREVNE